MSFMSVRQLTLQDVKPGFVQRNEDISDFGACSTLSCDFRLLATGTGSMKVVLQHSASGEVGSFFDIANVGWTITGTGGSGRFVVISQFLRYVRVAVDGGTLDSGTPMAQLDIIGRA
jgi:hypothetical protein